MENQEDYKPNFFESLFGIIYGIWQTGIGALQTFFGFATVRFFYSVPVFLLWAFVISPKFELPDLSFIEIWFILIAFDCIRFDITRFAPVAEQ